jgi:hypothetical protein
VDPGQGARRIGFALQKIDNACKLRFRDVVCVTFCAHLAIQLNPSLRREAIVKASAWLVAAAMLSISSLALAQSPQPTVREITDPAKIAEIERHAQELASGAQTTPGMGEQMREQDGMKHPAKKHHRKNKAKQKHPMKEKAPSDTPMATENKG